MTRHLTPLLLIVLAIALPALATGWTPASAQDDEPPSLTVTSADDSGDGLCDATCTLRDALIVERVAAAGDATAEELVDRCLDLCGPLEVSAQTRATLVEQAQEEGPLSFGNGATEEAATRVGRLVQLIVAAPEYQFA